MGKHKFLLSLILSAVAMGTVPQARAAEDDVPYWVSLRKDQSNLRVGPGREYRISWVYVRQGLPMKVLRVMSGWRLVEDPDGTRGWMLAQFLTRMHTGIVKGSTLGMRENKDGTGAIKWRVAPGVVGKLGDCNGGWCEFDIDGRKGFVTEHGVWGTGKP